MPTYCDKCSEVIDRPEELTRIDGDDLCLDCVPEPYGDFVRHVESTSQAIYDNLPNPSDVEQTISDLNTHVLGTEEHDRDLLNTAAFFLEDHLKKFYAIMQVANKLAGKEND